MIDLSTPNEWQHIDPENGLIMPWYTKSFLDELVTWDLKDKVMLEIGGGASTLWWNNKAHWVVTLESDKEYRTELRDEGCSVADFSIDFLKSQPLCYDIVIIDGIERDECVKPALDCLKPGGVLIIDNWLQPSVWVATEENQKLLTAMEHKIFKQEGHDDWQTAVFYKT